MLHGRTAHAWNGEEQARGRKVLFRAVARDAVGPALLGDAELCASQSRAARLRGAPDGLAVEQRNGVSAQTGVEEAKRIWQEYPLHDYGKDWDESGM
jgi:putative transposase